MLTDEQAQAVIGAVYEAVVMSIVETDTRPQCVRVTAEVEEDEVSLVFECEPLQWQPVGTATEVWIHSEAWSRARTGPGIIEMTSPNTLFGLPVIRDADAS